MKIAVIGATGNVGTKLISEALRRSHEVTAIARNPAKLAAQKNLLIQKGDVNNPAVLSTLLRNHDVVITATRFEQVDYDKLIGAVKESGVKRLLVVGGAGSLEVAPGVALISTPHFPAEYKAESAAGAEFLKKLRNETVLDWTYLSPSAMFIPDGHIGKFRQGKDELLKNSKGESKVYMADYAIAMIDEAEKTQHSRQRFTVVNAS